MKRVLALVGLLLVGMATIAYWLGGQLSQESKGWVTREVALHDLALSDSGLPRTLTKIRFEPSFGLGHGSARYFLCDGELDELQRFAQSEVQSIATEMQSKVVVTPNYMHREGREFDPAWMRPEPNAELVAYYVDRGSPIFIVVDQTNGLLYYSWGN